MKWLYDCRECEHHVIVEADEPWPPTVTCIGRPLEDPSEADSHGAMTATPIPEPQHFRPDDSPGHDPTDPELMGKA